MRASFLAGLLTCTAVVCVGRPAHAGLLSQHVDLIQVTPFVGAETVRLGLADLTGLKAPGVFTTSGATIGGVVGMRLGPLGLGFLVQHTDASDPANATLSLTKTYGELAINAQYGRVLIPVHFDFGYAYLATPDTSVRGPGGKIGIGVDVLALKVMSFGAGADFDVQGYSQNGKLIGGYGGTFVFRLGLHI
ncbi:MAG TPA: hypothetical protein VGQ83_22065 [Polyangia bacterium]|jgi:hypothetical protein